MITRSIESILWDYMAKGQGKAKKRAIVLLGARQTGKTTLMTMLAGRMNQPWLYWNCDEADIRRTLENTTSTQLRSLIGKTSLVMIDEAQRVPNIGLTLKLITDTLPSVQLIVSGSSSLQLSRSVNEPLTGRKSEFHIYPFSVKELADNTSATEEQRLLEHRLLYGLYPDVTQEPGQEKTILKNIVQSYLYQDIFAGQDIRRPELLERLVLALALQTGSECSYNELSRTTAMNKETVMRYIALLEGAFVIFRLGAFARNLRKELVRGQKYYFYDNGILNTIISNYQPMTARRDAGALWENFLMSERMKHRALFAPHYNSYFWRTVDKQELDYIEEEDGRITGYEFKWNPNASRRLPAGFTKAYPQAAVQFVNRENYWGFVTGQTG